MSRPELFADKLRAARPLNEAEIAYDLVFVLNMNSRGWILEKICRVIEQHSDLNCYYLFSERNDILTERLPKARAYFFAHYAIAFHTLLKHPEVFSADRYVWFTHPDPGKNIAHDDLAGMLNHCTHVFNPNTEHRRLLEFLGVDRGRISVPLGGADPEVFLPHARGRGGVGFVGAYYERKNPDTLLEIVERMPDVRFRLLTPGPADVVNRGLLWHNYPKFDRLRALPNLDYVEAAYETYPEHYAGMDVYVSASALEGGPIPLIEAMMANVVPVVSRTGFADDVVEHGRNGFVFPVGAPAQRICQLIREALAHPEWDVRGTALGYSWACFARTILDAMFPKAQAARPLSLVQSAPVQHLLREGWHRPEASGCWTAERRARLDLPLAAGAKPGFHLVRVQCWTFGTDQRPATTATLWSGRSAVASRTLEGNGPVELAGIVELDAAAAGRPIPLVLESSDLASPASLGIGGDTRQLGVKVGRITVEPLVTLQPDQQIRFRQGATPEGVLVSGWHATERFGTWSAAKVASLRLPVAPPPEGGGALVLRIRGRVHATRQIGAQRVGFRARVAGGGLVGGPADSPGAEVEIRFEDDTIREVALPLPPPAGRDPGSPFLVEIDIACARLVSPRTVDPASGDARPLGFFLAMLELATAASADGTGEGPDGAEEVRDVA